MYMKTRNNCFCLVVTLFAVQASLAQLTTNTLSMPDGSVYVGGVSNGMFEGSGLLLYGDGDSYEGEFRNGRLEGKGVFKYVEGDKYQGDYRHGRPEGTGVFTYADGGSYSGEYKNGRANGKGIEILPNGDKYQGLFKNDHLVEGVYADHEGMIYKGQFRLSRFEGVGVLQYPDGGEYEGEFKDGCLNGKGIMHWPNGEIYEGIFKDGEIVADGKGTIFPSRNKHILLSWWFLISLILNIVLIFRLKGRRSPKEEVAAHIPQQLDTNKTALSPVRDQPPMTTGMKMVFTSPGLVACDILKGILDGEGIPSLIKNENSSTMTGYSLPMPNAPVPAWGWPEVWVNNEDFEEASRIVSAFEKTQQIKEEPDQPAAKT